MRKKQIHIAPAPIRQPVEVLNPDPEQGLTPEQAKLRQECGWNNQPSDSMLPNEKQIVLHHCFTFFNLVFVVLAAFLAVVGSFKNMTFLLVVVLNTVIGIVQEIRAKRAVEKLTLVAERPVKAVRGGDLVDVPSRELVRDDIVIFGPGDQICADATVRSGTAQVNESLITGEADAIDKAEGAELKSGSFVVSGKVRAQLIRVGDDAYAEKLSREAKANPKAAKSEMMNSLDKLIKVVAIVLIPIGALLFWQEFFKLQLELRSSVEATVAALVGMIPEGLYLLTSVAMAVSAIKLTQKKVLVQDMNCIETLARVDVLCVDKTGTITEPRMEVENVVPLEGCDHQLLEDVMTALYAGQEPDNDTARAICEMFSGESTWEVEKRIPFNSRHKWSGAVFHNWGAYLVGAPEFILGQRYGEIQPQAEGWSATGYRVLLVAGYHGDPTPGALDPELVRPMALLLLTNRIRPEAPDTFRYFAQQGVAVKVISGDNPATVADVAARAAIENADKFVDAQTLETEEDFLQAVREYTVFGRVTPDKKKALILALKKQGHTVAMTGDGVNDVLAMRQANCGIGMAGGAQAATQVAQLVLTDGDFAGMPQIVAEGRRVINNIQRAAALFLVKNIFSLGLALLSLLTSWPYPLVPIQLTLISTLTIGVPSFFLAMEPNYERVTGSFIRGVLRKALPGGLTNIAVVMAAQAYRAAFGLTQEQTGTICAAILAAVGLLVLYQTCKPFDLFRRIIWGAMAVGLVGAFVFLGELFELHPGDEKVLLVMATLLAIAVSVFLVISRVFAWSDRMLEKQRQRREEKSKQ